MTTKNEKRAPVTDIKGLQEALNTHYGSKLVVDGLAGPKTMGLIEDTVLAGVKHTNWSDERKRIAAEQAIYKKAKITEEVVTVDGLVGPQTRYLRLVWAGEKIDRPADPEPKAPPKASEPVSVPATPSKAPAWPRQNESAMNAFFGARGTNQVKLELPFPMRIAWDLSKTIRSYDCHQKVRPHMLRIWTRTKEHYGYEELKRLRLDLYGGCLNVRKMRGGNAWSIHSWGCAQDVDPERNQLNWKRNAASLDNPEYNKFWEFVYDEGAISLGKERDYDWMHFQFAKL